MVIIGKIESQEKLLAKTVKYAGSKSETTLNQIIIADSLTTKSLPIEFLLDSQEPIEIGIEPLRLSDLEVAYTMPMEPIKPQNLVKVIKLKNLTCFL
jgi:hypothetical protein